MNNLLNVVIILVIIVFVIMVLNKKENEVDTTNSDLYREEDYAYLDDIFDQMETKKINNQQLNNKKITNQQLNNQQLIKPYFVDMRVHNDYRDTITSFNDIAPDQRPIFNRSVLPVKQIDVNPKEVKSLVKAFIKRVNDTVKYIITDELKANSGWDELSPEKKEQDGWKKQMRDLGLPDDLYLSPAKRAKVKLIKIDQVQKFATEEQLNYIVYMILQKKNAQDQMIVKVSYIMNNIDMNTDRQFNKDGYEVNLDVKIEEIAIIGFLTDHQYGDTTNRKDFYQFENIEKDDMMDPELILQQLKDKYKQRQIETDGFNLQIAPQKLNDQAIFRLSSERPLLPLNATNEFK